VRKFKHFEERRNYKHNSAHGGFNSQTQFTSNYFKRLKKWRGRPDYFKTSVENLVQEMFGQIDGILAIRANQTPEYSNISFTVLGGKSHTHRTT